jgi:DNA-binding MarR family transcriptional regulator
MKKIPSFPSFADSFKFSRSGRLKQIASSAKYITEDPTCRGGKRLTNGLALEDQILVALRRITRAIDVRSRTLLQDHGLTSPQLATLNVIAQKQPVTAGGIAAEVHLGRATVTGILDRLQRRGLVERARGEQDRRSVNVSLTEPGRDILGAAPSMLQDQFLCELANLKEWERTQILATLQRIADMMHVSKVDPSPVIAGTADKRSTADTARRGSKSFLQQRNENQPASINPT